MSGFIADLLSIDDISGTVPGVRKNVTIIVMTQFWSGNMLYLWPGKSHYCHLTRPNIRGLMQFCRASKMLVAIK